MTKEVETLDINKFTDNLFKKNKDTIINAEEAAEQYKISSGSLKLDYILQGGFGAGFHRLGGVSEGGKTSEAFLVMANMFKEMPTTRGVYVKTERLSADLQKRTGIEFVSDPMKWRDETASW